MTVTPCFATPDAAVFRTDLSMSRRSLLRGAMGLGGALAVPGRTAATPAFVRSGRPVLTHGVQSGDVGTSSGTVWTRADRPSRMVVQFCTRPISVTPAASRARCSRRRRT
jgi:phosphodiesterase/alkaline phosphatase D-like protein